LSIFCSICTKPTLNKENPILFVKKWDSWHGQILSV
jgi:hypothetical protein